MTDGHGVHPDASRQEYARRLLTALETGQGTSQRSLARRTGMALGLTNVILRMLVRSGWVSVTRVDGRVRYVITPEGATASARISTAYFAHTTRFYVEARDRVRSRLSQLSQAWTNGNGDTSKRVAFFGAAEVAEIGYVCVQESDLSIAAIFDRDGDRRFFGIPVRPETALADRRSWEEFAVLIVMAFDDRTRTRADAFFADIAFPLERVFWI